MKPSACTYLALPVAILASSLSTSASAAQYSYLEAGYSQEIYTAPLGTGWGPGFAWTPAGNLLLHGSSTIYEYSLTADTTYSGTPVHSSVAHAVTGDGGGWGMTNGLDGYLYANSPLGLQRIDTGTWTATTLPGTSSGYYGIGTLPDGRIVYSDGGTPSNIYIYNPSGGANSLIYTAGAFVDGLSVAPTGEIFLAVLGSTTVDVINSSGGVVNSFAVTHGPDGSAFGGGAAYFNNTDGTITRLTFAGPGYTGSVTETIFASGGTYGDLAGAGPDCSFYVSQWGTVNWANGPESNSTIVRISKDSGCGFTSGPTVPEPATYWLVGIGLAAFAVSRRLSEMA